jgi:translation elongation factor EF-1beta
MKIITLRILKLENLIMSNELKPINFGVNKFCVPAVMSALTGRSTDECAAVITSINGKQEIKAVNIPDIILAFRKLRYEVTEQPVRARTLYGILNKLVGVDGLYLIIVPHHIVAIRIEDGQIQICDNASREPLDARSSARLTQQVERIFKISPKPQPIFIGASYRIDKDWTEARIMKVSRYENPEDDTEVRLGYVRFTSDEEFKQIVRALENS